MKLLIYTFWIPRGPIAKTLFKYKDLLPEECKILYTSGDRGLNILKNSIIKYQPENIVGMGYSNRSAKYIKEERYFINRFGKRVIDPTGRATIESSLNLDLPMTKISEKPTWGRCNEFAYGVESTIKKSRLGSKSTFFHIPTLLHEEEFEVFFKAVLFRIDVNTL